MYAIIITHIPVSVKYDIMVLKFLKYACVIAVQHERYKMCLGMQRHTHIRLCNLVTTYNSSLFVSFSNQL